MQQINKLDVEDRSSYISSYSFNELSNFQITLSLSHCSSVSIRTECQYIFVEYFWKIDSRAQNKRLFICLSASQLKMKRGLSRCSPILSPSLSSSKVNSNSSNKLQYILIIQFHQSSDARMKYPSSRNILFVYKFVKNIFFLTQSSLILSYKGVVQRPYFHIYSFQKLLSSPFLNSIISNGFHFEFDSQGNQRQDAQASMEKFLSP